METKDHRPLHSVDESICALEWVTRAMDAAREVTELEDPGSFRLDYAQIYSEKLSGL